jgi:XRE family transcriptional regulator, master regulator for biofilm formation
MIGNIIYELRKKKGLTLSQLAERAEISKSYLSNIERNLNQNPSIHVVRKIANVLNVDMNILLYNDSTKEDHHLPDKELIELINELKESGFDKKEYKTLLEFIKWQNQNLGSKK